MLRKNEKHFFPQVKKTKIKMERQSPRTNGESKAIQTKSHTEAYTYTLTKRGKGEKIIYLAPKDHLFNLG